MMNAKPGDMLKAAPKFPLFEGKVEKIYCIASTMRSGSSLLARMLWETGVLGSPWEFFNPYAMDKLLSRDELLQTYTSPNGVFGAKVHWHQAIEATDEMPFDFFIHLTRRDKLAQAISLVRARQTGQWCSLQQEEVAPQYDFHGISEALQQIKAAEHSWEVFFADASVQPLRLVYEDFGKDTVRQVLKFLGVQEMSDPIELPELHRQADALTQEWKTRYLRDCELAEIPFFDDSFLAKLFPGASGRAPQAFARSLWQIAHTWDDLVDRDVPVADEAINAAFIEALLVLPNNTFYRKHFRELQPLVAAAITDWLTANQLEKSGRGLDLEVAFITRSAYIGVIQHAMLLHSGWQHALTMAPWLRRSCHREGFAVYAATPKP